MAFGFWIDLVSLLLASLVSLSFVAMNNYSASYVGLAITQVVSLSGCIQSWLKSYVDNMTRMSVVERMFQVQMIEQDNEPRIEKPVVVWPDRAEITFENVSLRYSENSQAVLKNVSFNVKSGEKIGIVGKAGSGKSSLINAFFRLENVQGTIFIGDVDIKNINISRLREKVSILPKEPLVFTATVRENLDMYGRFNDSLLWSALEAVELKTLVSSLNMFLHDGGVRFSVGQRQLLCLARVILEGNKILVLDDAMANVDEVTGELIKRVIDRHFNDCTVITVTRKANSVFNSDKIVVMDRGRLMEYDQPSILLSKKDGHLARMVEEELVLKRATYEEKSNEF